MVGEIGWEGEERFEEASFVEGAVGPHYEDFPFVHVAVVDEAYGDEIDWVFSQLCMVLLERLWCGETRGQSAKFRVLAMQTKKMGRYTRSRRLTIELSLEQFCSVVRHFSLTK